MNPNKQRQPDQRRPPEKPARKHENETPQRGAPKTQVPDYGDKPEQMPDIEDKQETYAGEDLPSTTDNPKPGIAQKGESREEI